MTLDEVQKNKVTGWIADGLNLAAIQKRLASEFSIHLTYMEVRLLVDDLKLTPKDPERAATVDLRAGAASAGESKPGSTPVAEEEFDSTAAPSSGESTGAGKVSVSVDQIARPGSVVSGKVTFSDGKSAEWYLDQLGRLGVVPRDKGYKPAAADVQVFQMQLQSELAKMGF